MFRVQLDRFGRDHQFARNLLVREISVEQVQNLEFSPGQRFQALFAPADLPWNLACAGTWSIATRMLCR